MINNNQLAVRGISLLRSHLKQLQASLLQSHYCISLKIQCSPFTHTPSLCRNSIEEDLNRGPPKLLVVQPRVRPNAHYKAKLKEAINLANSLDGQRDGYFSTDLSHKDAPPHLVVQNPLSSPGKSRSGTVSYFSWFNFVSHSNYPIRVVGRIFLTRKLLSYHVDFILCSILPNLCSCVLLCNFCFFFANLNK